MTLDGFCDHTVLNPDDAIHQHYTELLGQGDAILYGRTTYQLMEYWRTFLENPSDEEFMNAFAIAIDKIPKIVFSHTLKSVEWATAHLATRSPEEEVAALKQSPNDGRSKDIFVGSRSLIIQLMNQNLVDEYQICVHPVVAGNGLPLFEPINHRIMLKLIKTKTFNSGAVILYYEPTDKDNSP